MRYIANKIVFLHFKYKNCFQLFKSIFLLKCIPFRNKMKLFCNNLNTIALTLYLHTLNLILRPSTRNTFEILPYSLKANEAPLPEPGELIFMQIICMCKSFQNILLGYSTNEDEFGIVALPLVSLVE